MTRVLLDGRTRATALVLDEALSMWGGLDSQTGEIIDRRHPQSGSTVTGKVLVLPGGRGSSSASSVLAEAIRLGTAPAAIITAEPDDIILLGALAAEELYGTTLPIVVASRQLYQSIRTGDELVLEGDGTLSVTSSQ